MRNKIILTLLILLALIPIYQSNTQPATPIKHVIIIIEENHSLDNLFGVYPFGWPPIINNVTLSVMWPDGLYKNYTQLEQSKNGVLNYISVPNVPWLPWLGYSHPYYADAWDTVDPGEGRSTYYGDYWFDTANGFVYYSGSQSMAYFSYQQVGILWDYAEEYVLADNYYAPVMGYTEPNRIAYMIGMPPNFTSNEVSNAIPFQESIMYQLSKYNISWAYYVYGYTGGIPWPMDAFIGVDQYEDHFHSLSKFYNDVENGDLPAVSWVMLIGGSANKYDMHPPYNITAGAVELVKIINAVMRSSLWNSTVIFITFDEGGGYYDHVTPPALDRYGLGQRIPLLIISPYAKEGWVNNYTINGYTLLAFIEYNWHLPWLTNYVANSNVEGLLQSFNFTISRPPIILEPNNWTYPIPLQYPIHYGYIAKVSPNAGYSKLYPAPQLFFLLPLEILGFSLILSSLVVRKALLPGVLIMFLVLGISVYFNYINDIYSFVIQYYLYSSIVGVLIGGIFAVRRYRTYS